MSSSSSIEAALILSAMWLRFILVMTFWADGRTDGRKEADADDQLVAFVTAAHEVPKENWWRWTRRRPGE